MPPLTRSYTTKYRRVIVLSPLLRQCQDTFTMTLSFLTVKSIRKLSLVSKEIDALIILHPKLQKRIIRYFEKLFITKYNLDTAADVGSAGARGKKHLTIRISCPYTLYQQQRTFPVFSEFRRRLARIKTSSLNKLIRDMPSFEKKKTKKATTVKTTTADGAEEEPKWAPCILPTDTTATATATLVSACLVCRQTNVSISFKKTHHPSRLAVATGTITGGADGGADATTNADVAPAPALLQLACLNPCCMHKITLPCLFLPCEFCATSRRVLVRSSIACGSCEQVICEKCSILCENCDSVCCSECTFICFNCDAIVW